MKYLQKGFTTMELIIVVAIITIVFSAIVIDIRPDAKEKLEMATERFVADVKYIRNLSISRSEILEGYPVGGYGIVIFSSRNAYVLYEADDNLGYQVGGKDTFILERDFDSIYNGEIDIHFLDSQNAFLEFLSETDIKYSISGFAGDRPFTTAYIRAPSISRQSKTTIIEEANDGQVFATLGVEYIDI